MGFVLTKYRDCGVRVLPLKRGPTKYIHVDIIKNFKIFLVFIKKTIEMCVTCLTCNYSLYYDQKTLYEIYDIKSNNTLFI